MSSESQPLNPISTDSLTEESALSSLLNSLNPEQKAAAAYRGGPLLILAGAGTGKTRVITHRIASLIAQGVPAGRILAITFTNKATEEMRRRISSLVQGEGHKVWVYTFHSFASRLLRQHAGLLKLSPYFSIYDDDDQKKMVQEALKELGLTDQKNKASLFVHLISRAKDDLLDAQSYAINAAASGETFRQTVAKVYEKYQAKLAQAGGVDFGDLLMKCVELLRDHQDIREYYQEYFMHVLVDEYQDTNHAQYVLTRMLAGKHRQLCVVGDEDQSVYKFRGADIRNILEFERDFSDAKVMKLEQNYRSTPNILNAATRVIQNNRSRKPKTLWTERPDGETVVVTELQTESQEARWVTQRIGEWVEEGGSLRDVAIFYRTNAQSRSFEEALRRAQIAYRLFGTVRFYDRKEVKDVLAYARVLLNPSDSINLARILNVPQRGIGKTSQEKIQQFAMNRGMSLLEALGQELMIEGLTPGSRRGIQDLVRLLENLRERTDLPPAQILEQILHRSGYLKQLEEDVETDLEAASRLDNLQELVNAAKEFEEIVLATGNVPSLAGYLESVSLQTDLDAYDPNQSAVTLMTVHLAKGLEFPAVFLTGLEEGLFPIGAANSSPEDLEEERRLCYVGMTRAKDLLILSYSSTRRIFGQVYSNMPSRFILEAQLLPETSTGKVTPPEMHILPPNSSLVYRKISMWMRVKHPEFGAGKVVEQSGSGETLKVTVQFENGYKRKFLLRYAPLEVL
ncbi:MAG: UvrD-helicase domain-containing protein [Elusimicrobia bacterium]|nr:UvrD-helicase domain-containing protein [Elusimicrobiota bacterium]